MATQNRRWLTALAPVAETASTSADTDMITFFLRSHQFFPNFFQNLYPSGVLA